ncbi:GcrA family cell cycle regulator [Sphingosinicella soli]|uniref:GcrA cell cycle regulator n=1 Tax=Sphingosinicella soli TaxID=333708 RepID=A0A7W7F6J5_9SPHN|nr:GcrA family cell cycle regulator [Sphingosinicella soli]MBB4631657.1 GcrA cell cycle regulator [Sphingosinicella soli]
MSWTDERIETLRTLWEKGLTASQIAEKLGNVSRNAVIGKAHRLGLKARPSPVKADSDGTPRDTAKKAAAPPAAPKPKPEAAAQAATPAPRPAPETKAPAPAAPKPMQTRPTIPAAPAKPRAPGEKVTLLDLSDKICKWPIGHPGEPDFQFCGRPVNPSFPYCLAHCAEAYQAQLPRDRNRPSRAPMPPLPRVR